MFERGGFSSEEKSLGFLVWVLMGSVGDRAKADVVAMGLLTSELL